GRSRVYAEIAERRGWSKDELEREISVRKRILVAMKQQNIVDYIDVSKIFHTYNIDPERVVTAIDDLAEILK
ncbi:MAG TPA: secretion system protein E, partial [Methanoregulaceae archaeon]|nr:secretion system protein E [Methanoregulaceae archaeon]